MSGQGALRERALLLEELRQIVLAMKNLAYTEIERLARIRPAQAQARETVRCALEALPRAAPAQEAAAPGGPACWIVIGAGRGFCGAFNDTLAAAARQIVRDDPAVRLLVAGRRLQELLAASTAAPCVLSGCASLADAEAALDEWLAALAVEAARCHAGWMLYASATGIARVRLWPGGQAADGGARAGARIEPLRQLALPVLRRALARQALRLLLQGGLCDSLEQENRARLAQMQRAQDHLDDLGQSLRRRYAALRQADITNETETLMSNLQAASDGSAAR